MRKSASISYVLPFPWPILIELITCFPFNIFWKPIRAHPRIQRTWKLCLFGHESSVATFNIPNRNYLERLTERPFPADFHYQKKDGPFHYPNSIDALPHPINLFRAPALPIRIPQKEWINRKRHQENFRRRLYLMHIYMTANHLLS